MKLLFRLLLFMFPVLTSCSSKTNLIRKDKSQILENRFKSNDAISSKDTTALSYFWMEDYHLISSRNSEATGILKNQQLFAREFSTKSKLNYVRTPTQIQVFSPWGMASEVGTWTGQWLESDGLVQLEGIYFAKWHKIGQEWKIRSETFVPLSCSGSVFCQQSPF